MCNKNNFSNKVSNDRMLLVLAAPSISEPYYKSVFKQIVDFQIDYTKAIIGHDNVILIVNKKTKSYYDAKLPNDILIVTDIYDIWLRDFGTINPLNPVLFKYTSASMSENDSKYVQNSFIKFLKHYNIQSKTSSLLLDGGNIVDNYVGKIVTTKRFLEDNNIEYSNAKQCLKELLNVSEVAIIDYDEPRLAHADGMVMWLGDDTLALNHYKSDIEFHQSILKELRNSFSNINIVEVPFEDSQQASKKWDEFESACGVHLNSVMTFNNIYIPIFDIPNDKRVINIIKHNTKKNIITVNAKNVCQMGGSLRCMTWQLAGENAEKLILAARDTI